MIPTLILLGGMIGLYLYAGQQERSAVQQQEPAATVTAAPAAENSADGRLTEAVLQTFSDAQYVLQQKENDTDAYAICDQAGERQADLLLGVQGTRVNGMILRVPLEKKPETKKNPTAIETVLLERYENRTKTVSMQLPKLLETAFSAMDPYNEVPMTVRQRWLTEIPAAMCEQKTLSDSGSAIRLNVYYGENKAQEIPGFFMDIALQNK